jgi:hypothetical protein
MRIWHPLARGSPNSVVEPGPTFVRLVGMLRASADNTKTWGALEMRQSEEGGEALRQSCAVALGCIQG